MKKITLLLFTMLSFTLMGQPSSTPPTPTQAGADVISVFSDTYSSAASLTPTTFGQSGNTAAVVNAAGNDVYEFTIVDGDFQGFELGNAIDLTAMENMHYDIWIEGTTAVGAIFNTTVSYHAGGHLTGQTTGYVDTNAIAQGQEGTWLSFDIPFSEFAPDMSSNPRDIISQLVFSYTNLSDTGPIYIDNIYFWKPSTDPNADATLSDLTLDGVTISGFSSNTFTYNVELPNGTMTAPLVAGVATQAGSGSSNVSVTQASGVPGSATLDVTAPNGTDMQAYTVNFTEAPLAPTTDAPQSPSTGTDLYVYSDIVGPTVTNFNFQAFAGGGPYTQIDIEGNGNSAGRIQNLAFYGAQWDAVDLDAGGYNFVHISYFATTTTEFNFYLIDQTAGIPGGNPEEPRYRFGGATPDESIVTGSWQSVFIPLTVFTDYPSPSFSYDLNDIFQYKFDGNGELYFDNIFFSSTNVLNVDELDLNEFTVSPNPTNSVWNVRTNNQEITSINVFDILGKEVVRLSPNSTEASIDASQLRDGIYLAKISSANGTKTIKLVKN